MPRRRKRQQAKKLIIPHRNSIWWTPWIKGMWVNLAGSIVNDNKKKPIYIPARTRRRHRQAVQIQGHDPYDGHDDFGDFVQVADMQFEIEDIGLYPWDML